MTPMRGPGPAEFLAPRDWTTLFNSGTAAPSDFGGLVATGTQTVPSPVDFASKPQNGRFSESSQTLGDTAEVVDPSYINAALTAGAHAAELSNTPSPSVPLYSRAASSWREGRRRSSTATSRPSDQR